MNEANDFTSSEYKIKFGTDGIRGTFGETPITEAVAFSVGYAVAKLIGGRVIISRDTRPSGLILEKSLSDGVLSAGGTPIITGVLPTSGMATALMKRLGDSGIMITASHNPFYDNGFKVLSSGGSKLNSEQEQNLEFLINEISRENVRTSFKLALLESVRKFYEMKILQLFLQ